MENAVDGLVFVANAITVDESAMTGESNKLPRETIENCIKRRTVKDAERTHEGKKDQDRKPHDIPSPVILSGTNMATGEGKMICLVVGESSCKGKILKDLKEENE